MSALEAEIAANFEKFHSQWQTQLAANVKLLEKSPLLFESYRRLTALQALRARIITPKYSSGSASFFLEAQNDALISHVNATTGSWRAALQSLRSVLENALNAVYYRDHEVELMLWENGDFRISPAELRAYVARHPFISRHEPKLKIMETIEAEYATLSKAVHGSKASFRMTAADTGISLWSSDTAKLGMWSTRHQKVVQAVTMLFATLHAAELQGTQNSDLRSVMYFAISQSKRTAMKSALKVSILSP